MSARRVLVLASSYPAWSDDPAGHFVRADAEALAAEGAEVHVVVPGRAGTTREGALTVHRLGGEALFGWPGVMTRVRAQPSRLAETVPVLWRGLAATRTLGSFDEVVAHWLVPAGVLGALIATRAPGRLRLVAHGADVRLLATLSPALRGAVLAWLLDRGARFQLVASALRAPLMAGLSAALVSRFEAASEVVPAPMLMPTRSSLPDPRAGSGIAGPYVVWVGRDVPSKRLALAIEAALRAKVTLVIVGVATPPAPPPGVVHHLGLRPRREALAWIAHADLLLSTSAEEGAPTVVREARSLGVPVVACPAGDLAAWAREDGGIELTSPSSPALATAITRRRAPPDPRGR